MSNTRELTQFTSNRFKASTHQTHTRTHTPRHKTPTFTHHKTLTQNTYIHTPQNTMAYTHASTQTACAAPPTLPPIHTDFYNTHYCGNDTMTSGNPFIVRLFMLFVWFAAVTALFDMFWTQIEQFIQETDAEPSENDRESNGEDKIDNDEDKTDGDEDTNASSSNAEDSYLARPLYKALFTGSWRTENGEKQFQKVLDMFHPDDRDMLQILTQKDEGDMQTESALNIFNWAYGFDATVGATRGGYFLSAGLGRGSGQINVVNANGDIVDRFTCFGIPRNETPEQAQARTDQLNDVLSEIASKYEIVVAVFFDSFFHLVKNTDAPFVPDHGSLFPQFEDIPFLKEFETHLGITNNPLPNTRALFVRNFKLPPTLFRDDTEEYKIGFISGSEPMFDIGSGNAALVNPTNGTKIEEHEIESINETYHLKSLAEWISRQ